MPRPRSWWRITPCGLPIASAHLLHGKGPIELLHGEEFGIGSLNPGLEFVSLVDPVVPILYSLPGLLIHLDALQLHQGNGKLALFPLDQHKHFLVAILSGGHSHYLNFLSWFQRRGRATNDTLGRERKLQSVVEIVV